MSFTILQNEKNAFFGYENKKFKKSKNCHFSKGVDPWFWSKIGHFSISFREYWPEKCVLRYFRTKNLFLGYKNKKLKKSKNYQFSKGVSSWFWSRIGNFFHQCVLGKIGRENVFHNILESKNACLVQKSNQLKQSKNWYFFNGVSPWFLSKSWKFFLFFRQNRVGKCALRYSRK